jgi:RNA polymerase sigma-70 factor (ECF subfamily)
VQGADVPDDSKHEQRAIVDAFLAASRRGDFDALVALLDPDVVVRMNGKQTADGATEIAARAIKGGARAAQPALVNGEIAVVVAPKGKLLMVIRFTIANGKITALESVTKTENLEIAVLP